MNINETHFLKFKDFIHCKIDWSRRKPKEWFKSCFPEQMVSEVLNELPELQLSRNDVRKYCLKESNHSDQACFFVVMAWGGMKTPNARRAWKAINNLLPIISSCRNLPDIDKAALFDMFKNAHIPGLGPAFFTKLMYFLRPVEDGCYILDQWTARSVNLLSSVPIIHIPRNWVTSMNTGQQYIEYCKFVEFLTSELTKRYEINLDAAQVEEAMFAGGTQHLWRTYLKCTDIHLKSSAQLAKFSTLYSQSSKH